MATIEKVISFVNDALSHGETMDKISRAMGIEEEELYRKLFNGGCVRIKDRFEQISPKELEEVTVVTSEVIEVAPVEQKEIIDVEYYEATEEEAALSILKNIESFMINLDSKYTSIIEAVDSIKSLTCVAASLTEPIKNNIVIELPEETVKGYRNSMRVNNVEWDNFKKFCEDRKEYDKADLYSMALKEYREKYEK